MLRGFESRETLFRILALGQLRAENNIGEGARQLGGECGIAQLFDIAGRYGFSKPYASRIF
jgi:hypothetical protein